jgi:deoxyribodipyrimidine photo-lyase
VTSSIVWLRRDLRLHDNVALYNACRRSDRVCLAFVLDRTLLSSERMGAPLVQSFFGALAWLRERLRALGSDLALLEGDFAGELIRLARRVDATTVFYNEDYEPDAIRRDAEVTKTLRAAGIRVHAFLDHVYFGADEVDQSGGGAYRVFTPYRKRWLDQRQLSRRMPLPSPAELNARLLPRVNIGETRAVPSPETYGYRSSPHYPHVNGEAGPETLARFLEAGGPAERYKSERNLPALEGTSRLSPQLRAGTVGIRECVESAFARAEKCDGEARAGLETWISELVWRDFYQMILKRFPHVATSAFVERANHIPWRSSEADFSAWCEGRTGYPLVDAAMRQLNVYGWMHNRLRMVVASFLVKDLLIDWRLGERYFERHLADADLAQNNGGWQWAASTGTDAAPYFRIFNPVRQSKSFDAAGAFIRSMVPELAAVPESYVHEPWTMPPLVQLELHCEIGRDYPAPIVNHEVARARAILTFAPVLGREDRVDRSNSAHGL